MNDSPSDIDRLLYLADVVCGETVSEDDLSQLDAILLADDASRRCYLDYCRMHMALGLELRAQEAVEKLCRQIDLGAEAPDTAAVIPLTPSAQSSPLFTFLGNTIYGTVGFFSQEYPRALLIATVLTGLGLWIGSHIYITHDVPIADESSPHVERPVASTREPEPKIEYVGKITGMVDCRWETERLGIRDWGLETAENHKSEIINHKSLVALGDKFALASGLMEITYDTGAKVILQGPVTYEVESNGGYLSVGKLTGKLEKKNDECRMMNDELRTARNDIHHSSFSTQHLFIVRTPTATVTDLGTEFGVEVSKEGHTTSHVFHGSVQLQMVAVDGKAEGDAQVLHENQSARVEKNDGNQDSGNRVTVFVTPVKLADFVREIPRDNPKPIIKTFDLVDVVAGGDGFSGRRNAGIDPANGKTYDKLPKPVLDVKDYTIGDRKYHRVEKRPFVDGVFIPDGSRGPMQTDSAGHTFDGFPTTANQTVEYVWAGGAIHYGPPFEDVPTVLDGVDYASPGHGVLYMYSNKAVTFDLDAIRRANPGCRLVRFRAVAGNTETASEKGAAVYADLWVLVDGQVRFRCNQISRFNGVFPIVFPINESERFLTLAATDGGNGIANDWILFGDPRLELVLAKTGTISISQKTIKNETIVNVHKGLRP